MQATLKYTGAIIISWLFTSVVLFVYSQLLDELVGAGNLYRELAICGGQVLFQSMVMLFVSRERTLLYLVNMMAVSFGGAILLLPAIIFRWYTGTTNAQVYACYFLAVAGMMLLAHLYRMKKLGLPLLLSASWVGYRILVLIIILIIL